VIRILEQAHGILDDDLILKANELGDLFGDPWFYDLQIYFFHVHLRRKETMRALLVCNDATTHFFVEFWRELD